MNAALSPVMHRVLDSNLPLATGGEGVWIRDAAGRRWLDASGGAAVSCLGHAHPRVVEAIREQAGRLAYAHSGFFANDPSEALAEALLARAPENFRGGAVLFLGSGSEAMEAAIKLARQYWLEVGEPARDRFVARDMAYHGNTLGALALGGHPSRRAPYAPLLMDVARAPAAFAFRLADPGESEADYAARAAAGVAAAFEANGPGRTAAFAAETVSGASLGAVAAPEGYFAAVRALCDADGALLIADEVMCGMGRCGPFFAFEAEGIAPDLVVVAKGLGAGYLPVSAVLVSARVAGALRAGSARLANGHTYMSHALACAGALAVLETIEDERLLDRVGPLGARLDAALRARLEDDPNVADIRGRGLFRAGELVRDRETGDPFEPSEGLADRVKAEGMAAGLVCYPSPGARWTGPDGRPGRCGDHVLLAPA
ncbi:MAG: aspartate aminotransferase family protein [Pseudomonadota bacterium]|nr:aspartate aminotransferase family protein [Pseudomonadota bacterium]